MIGTHIYGYCNGFFGRDDYDEKIIILEGKKWIVCTYANSEMVTHCNFDSQEEKEQYLKEWSEHEEDW